MPQASGKKLEQCCTELLMHLDDLEVGETFSLQQMSLLLEGCDERKLVLICEVLEALTMVKASRTSQISTSLRSSHPSSSSDVCWRLNVSPTSKSSRCINNSVQHCSSFLPLAWG